MNQVYHADDSNFADVVGKATVPVLVDFYAPWCMPCKAMGPVLDSLAQELGETASIVKVNVDDAPQVAGAFSVRAVPTFALLCGGEVQEMFSGVVPADALREKLLALVETCNTQ